ncbi:hypothetical protein DO021_06245 [Desulfobacter hydrogenophilus]|uniref:Phage tail protein n=1 Tax=Desulfobacter hydrogenophilus TaxID=2291 RepID=A0A328FDX7_9BACT|nr:hypothetical protein [Desulfobacter hydrogenophilus]NDY71146.1 hypothetical protein [Desulfobacter hydrogenophilus]QBH14252.1 hypothetical protein EYB58_15815 [Desulfobacter hydrogenophilus]RAM02818.1 hypothetical protein DO021_06245 [Desulfobacter hydrogenophilus]
MRGITFNNLPPIRQAAQDRMDVACFIGFAPLARTPLFSNTLKQWLNGYGWDRDKIQRLDTEPGVIRNTPVPLESWDAFLAIFGENRLGFEAVQVEAHYLPHYAGAAIKAFFRQGGRKCYFICMGSPLPYHAPDIEKARQLYTLIWGKEKSDAAIGDMEIFTQKEWLHIWFPAIPHGASPVDDWYGVSHLAGLSDVTYVCFPDLVDVLGNPAGETPEKQVVEKTEVFVPCSESEAEPDWFYAEYEKLPEYTATAFAVWKRVVKHILTFLSAHNPTVQLVAGLPIPVNNILKEFEDFVADNLLAEAEHNETDYKHLQLCFPWLKTDRSGNLPDALEPPEGILLGILAAQSGRIGAFRSVAGSYVETAYDLSPRNIDAYGSRLTTGLSFADQVSWFDFVPDGIRLQSDVTAVLHGNYRYGAVRRIMILIQRAAHRIGLDYVFEPGSERVWRSIKSSLTDLLHRIYLKNGLRGKSANDAYSVACGRSTMTQNDIDNGRLIANVSLQPAVPIEAIAVDILMERDRAVLFGGESG